MWQVCLCLPLKCPACLQAAHRAALALPVNPKCFPHPSLAHAFHATPQELLSEVKSHMASLLPAYKVNEVAVSMWALARLKAQPGLRLMAAALQHCFSQVGDVRGWAWADGRVEGSVKFSAPRGPGWAGVLCVLGGFLCACVLTALMAGPFLGYATRADRHSLCAACCAVLCVAAAPQARLLTPTGLSMLMWSVGNMETAPPKAWVAKLLVATQVS